MRIAENQSNERLKRPEEQNIDKLEADCQDEATVGTLTECVICKSKIKRGAKKCTRCNSFQHPVRRFFSGIDIYALIALVPVVTLAFVFVKDHVVVHKSDLRVAILDCEHDRIRVVASNLGDRAAILHERATLLFVVDGQADPRPRLLMKDPQSAVSPLIKPGESLLIDFFPVTKNGKKARLDVCPADSKQCEYKVTFSVIAFDHKPYKIVMSCISPGR